MKRRDFLQVMAAAGLTAQSSLKLSGAQAAPVIPGHYVVVLNAGGGWDPTSLIDPKGDNQAYTNQSTRHNGSTNSVGLNNSNRVGEIQWSDVPSVFGAAEQTIIDTQFSDFFSTYGNRLTVVNGIDNGTNNHNSGNRATWSGNLEEGYPSLAALYAATVSSSLPMSFISNGGYDFTASLVARARASSANFINEISDPSYHYTNSNNVYGFHYRNSNSSTDHYKLIKQAQAARIQRQQQDAQLALRRKQLSQLFTVRGEESNLSALQTSLTDVRTNGPDMDAQWHNNRSENLKSQAQVVAAAFKANLAAGANLNIGGFDTHGNHDVSQYRALGNLLEGLHFLQECLDYLGIANKTTVVVGSDFGRTPFYNSGNGKDHWPVTSQMVLNAGSTGGKVFGASTTAFRSQKLNLQTGQPDNSGVVMTAAHVNQALRRKLGIHNHAFAQEYPLSVEDFNIFG